MGLVSSTKGGREGQRGGRLGGWWKDAPEAMGEDGGGAGIGEGFGARGTRYRLGRICLEQTGHQEVSRWFMVSAG